MAEKQGLLSSGWSMVGRNKRYIVWFYLLNLTLAEYGTAAFRNQAHEILDHSLQADRLVHGFSMGVFTEMFARPEFGPIKASTMPAMYFALLFFVALYLQVVGNDSPYRTALDFVPMAGGMVVAALVVYSIYRIVQFRKHKVYRVVPRVQVQELAARLASDEASHVLIVDVRSHGYYDSGGARIKGSIRIEPNNLEEEIKNLPRDKDIYLYCT